VWDKAEKKFGTKFDEQRLLSGAGKCAILGPMARLARLAAGLALLCGVSLRADSPPEAEITNAPLRVRLYLPDARTGFYRGTRFDWSGVIGSLQYSGHEYYAPWFQQTDPHVHDFTYRGEEIVAGPCTAITGPAEEFVKPLGFDEVAPGGTFIKIGVGVLRKPDTNQYDPFRLYEIVGGEWTVNRHADAVEFRQEVTDRSTGYRYDYHKTVFIDKVRPRMVLEHRLRNMGARPIKTSVYNHNFLYLDRQPPGPDFSITVPFPLQSAEANSEQPAVIRNNQIVFAKPLMGTNRVYLGLTGFGATAKDYEIRVENRKVGAGVRITADRSLSRLALWAIRAPLSIEPFIDLSIDPGAEVSWRITYDFYTEHRD
jgi:hypothetical protein